MNPSISYLPASKFLWKCQSKYNLFLSFLPRSIKYEMLSFWKNSGVGKKLSALLSTPSLTPTVGRLGEGMSPGAIAHFFLHGVAVPGSQSSSPWPHHVSGFLWHRMLWSAAGSCAWWGKTKCHFQCWSQEGVCGVGCGAEWEERLWAPYLNNALLAQ